MHLLVFNVFFSSDHLLKIFFVFVFFSQLQLYTIYIEFDLLFHCDGTFSAIGSRPIHRTIFVL